MGVERVARELALDSVSVRERVDQLLAGILDPGGEPRVQLDAIARLERGVLADGGTALGAEAESADALA